MNRYTEKEALRVLRNDVRHYLKLKIDTPEVNFYLGTLELLVEGQLRKFEKEELED